MVKRYDKVKTGMEKLKLLTAAKNEDVEFAAAEADGDDLEARDRAAEADKRQLREMLREEQE